MSEATPPVPRTVILPVTLLAFVKAPSTKHHGSTLEAPPSEPDVLGYRDGGSGAGSFWEGGSGASKPFRAGWVASWLQARALGSATLQADLHPYAPEVDAGAPPVPRKYAIKSAVGSDMLRRAISGIDDYLSHCCGVKPFSLDEHCLLRHAMMSSPGAYHLSDGTRLEPGDLVVDLHLWNEHIPPVPEQGPDMAWARLVAQMLKHSLHLLAETLEADPELRGAKAIRAKTNFVGWRDHSESMSRLIRRFGFEDVDEGAASVPVRVHDAFENILIGALTWTHNPEALRRNKLIRQRRPVWMSAGKLLDLHGPRGRG